MILWVDWAVLLVWIISLGLESIGRPPLDAGLSGPGTAGPPSHGKNFSSTGKADEPQCANTFKGFAFLTLLISYWPKQVTYQGHIQGAQK